MTQIAEQREPASQVQRKARFSTLPADSLQHSPPLQKAFCPRHDSSHTVICPKAASSADESEILRHRSSHRPASLTLLLFHRSGSTAPALPLVLFHEHSRFSAQPPRLCLRQMTAPLSSPTVSRRGATRRKIRSRQQLQCPQRQPYDAAAQQESAGESSSLA